MKTTVFSKGSRVRCYACGSPNVKSICHHCGRPTCAEHGPVKPALGWFTENREFQKLTLGHWPFQGSDGAHCEFHVHSTLNFRRIMIYPGAFILLLGVALLVLTIGPLVACLSNQPGNTVISVPGLSEVLRDPAIYDGINEAVCYLPQTLSNGLAILQALGVLGFGIGIIMIGVRLNRENIAPEVVEQGITLPLGPATNRIRVVENLPLKVSINKSGEAISEILGGIQGEINPSFVFTTQDVTRIKEYRDKYRIADDKNLAFQAGYFILQGNPHLTPIRDKNGQGRTSQNDSMPYRTGMRNAIKVWGHVQDHPFFSEKSGRPSFAWQKSWCYIVKQDDVWNGEEARDRSPVWILPVLFERGDTKILALNVQLNTAYFPGLDKILADKESAMAKRVWIERARLNKLSYRQFGQPQVENAICSESKDEEGGKYYDIEWHDALFNPNGNSHNYIIFDGFRILFTHEIAPDAKLEGHMVLRVPSLVSGIQGIQYYSALGQNAPRENLQKELLTYVHVDFDIVLSRTALSHFVAAPCTTLEQPGAPTPGRIYHILNRFHAKSDSAERIFIYRVVESQPQLGDERAQTGRWHWQLFGKRYSGVTPIDFHIVIYGRGDQEKKGVTRIETSIMANVDKETAGEIENTRKKIEAILHAALDAESQSEVHHA